MRRLMTALILVGGVLSNSAKAATEINISYDYIHKDLITNKETNGHGSGGFTLLGNEMYLYSNGLLFHQIINQDLQLENKGGTIYVMRLVMMKNHITEYSFFTGHLITQKININGDNCSVNVKIGALPGNKVMTYTSNSQEIPMRADHYHNMVCTIRKTNWQPPQ